MSNANSNPAANGKSRMAGPPPALDFENPRKTQPYREFLQRGWITEFVYSGSSLTETMKVKVSQDVSSSKKDSWIAPAEAKALIISAGLWTNQKVQKSAGKKETREPALPKKSLVKGDFEKGREHLALRVAEVSANLGPTTCKGRIGSLEMYLEGADTFHKWWRVAHSRAKCRLLMDGKRYKEINDDHYGLVDQAHSACPFRDEAIPTPREEEEDEQFEKAPETPREASPGNSQKGN